MQLNNQFRNLFRIGNIQLFLSVLETNRFKCLQNTVRAFINLLIELLEHG